MLSSTYLYIQCLYSVRVFWQISGRTCNDGSRGRSMGSTAGVGLQALRVLVPQQGVMNTAAPCCMPLETRAGAVYGSPLQLPKMPMRQIRRGVTPDGSPTGDTQVDPVRVCHRSMQDDRMCACLPSRLMQWCTCNCMQCHKPGLQTVSEDCLSAKKCDLVEDKLCDWAI